MLHVHTSPESSYFRSISPTLAVIAPVKDTAQSEIEKPGPNIISGPGKWQGYFESAGRTRKCNRGALSTCR